MVIGIVELQGKNCLPGSQIAIPFAKWRISSMSDMQFCKSHDSRETLYSEAFEVADYEFDIGFPFFKMADQIWRTLNFGNSTFFAQLPR